MLKFLKTTVLGGAMFLVPIVIFIVVIEKAIQLTSTVAAPIARVVPAETFAGLAVLQMIALGIVVAVCFLAGLAARTRRARNVVQSLESNVLDKIPAYALMKAKTGSMLSPEDTEDMLPVLITFDDSWQFGYEVERLDHDRTIVFLPGAPDPWSGSVCAVTSDRVTPVQINIQEVAALMKRLGKGSTEALRRSLEVSHG